MINKNTTWAEPKNRPEIKKITMHHSVFDFEYRNLTKLKWWERFLLFFRKKYYSVDLGYQEDKSVMLAFKKLRGKIYLVDEKILNKKDKK